MLEIGLQYDPFIQFLAYSKRILLPIIEIPYSSMFIDNVFTRTKKEKQPICQLSVKWMVEISFIYTTYVIYCKKNKIHK